MMTTESYRRNSTFTQLQQSRNRLDIHSQPGTVVTPGDIEKVAPKKVYNFYITVLGSILYG